MISLAETLVLSQPSLLHEELLQFGEFGTATSYFPATGDDSDSVPVYENEFWTSKQRVANRLHEISYRACFKPQLPRFFIERLTKPGDVVFDPFMGRGTTLLEAAILGRIPRGCDVNPLCQRLVTPRLSPPTVEQVKERLDTIPFQIQCEVREDLHVFYHPQTLSQIHALRSWFADREKDGLFDSVDAWIQMVAVNRLTGHSSGFFSVYTLPPNQAVSIESQRKINARLNQQPTFRNVPDLVLAKTRSLLRDTTPAIRANITTLAKRATIFTSNSKHVPSLPDASVDLIVTSPPFLDIVDYAADNWLRCWFLGIDPNIPTFAIHSKLVEWETAMCCSLREMHRVLRPGGWVAFEVGELRRGTVRLEESVIPAGLRAGLTPMLVLINRQQFTKTANCWGIKNNTLGTNSNRVVLFQKIS